MRLLNLIGAKAALAIGQSLPDLPETEHGKGHEEKGQEGRLLAAGPARSDLRRSPSSLPGTELDPEMH